MGWMGHKRVLALGLLLCSMEAQAVPFISYDVRANAMGGAGVAATPSASTVFTNPALSHASQSQWAAEAAAVFRFSDPRNLQDEIDNYHSDELESLFEAALIAFKADSSTPTPRADLATATQNMAAQLNRFSTRAIEREVSMGLAVSLPGSLPRSLSDKPMTLVVQQQTVGGARLVNVAQELARFVALIDDGLNKTEKGPDDEVFNIVISGAGRNMQSRLHSRGALIREVGVAMVREVAWRGQALEVGIAPKYVDVTTFDSLQSLASAATYDSQSGQQHYSSYNVDLGVAATREGGWRGGLAIKNLISHRYPTALAGGAIRIQPQARVGIAHSGEWFATALDLDLNEAKAMGLGTSSQYLSLGGELSLTKNVRLRGGYRHNISSTKASMATIGSGFGLFGAVVDVAMSINQDGLGFSGRVGLQF